MNSTRIKLYVAICSSVLTLALIKQFVDGDLAGWLVEHCGYWFMLGTVSLFVYLIIKTLRNSKTDWVGKAKRHRNGILVILACSVYTHLHEPHAMKVFYDEPVISSMGMMMHTERIPAVAIRGHYMEGQLQFINYFKDKRPYFFAFILSCLHDLTGYRVANVFILNALLTPLLFVGIYWWGATIRDRQTGILLTLIFTSLPLIAQNVTGGGFEVLNLVMILALLASVSHYLKTPDTQGLNLMVMISVLLAQTRYESIIYTAGVALAILYKWNKDKKIGLTWFSSLAPWLLAPALIVQQVYFSNEGFWQLNSNQTNAFSLEYLHSNIELAIFYLFNFDTDTTNSLLLSLLGTISLVILPITYLRRKRLLTHPGPGAAFLFIIPFSIFNFLLLQLYFWGQLNDPVVSRLALPFMLSMTLAIPFALREILGKRPVPLLAYVGIILFIVGVTTHANSRAYISNRILQLHEARLLSETIDKYGYDKTRILVLAKSSVPLLIDGYASIPANALRLFSQKVKYALDKSLYEEVILVQNYTVDYTDNYQFHNASNTDFDLFFETEELDRAWYRMDRVTIIKRVTAVKPSSDELKRSGLKKELRDDANFEHWKSNEYPYTDDPVEGFTDIDSYLDHRLLMLP